MISYALGAVLQCSLLSSVDIKIQKRSVLRKLMALHMHPEIKNSAASLCLSEITAQRRRLNEFIFSELYLHELVKMETLPPFCDEVFFLTVFQVAVVMQLTSFRSALRKLYVSKKSELSVEVERVIAKIRDELRILPSWSGERKSSRDWSTVLSSTTGIWFISTVGQGCDINKKDANEKVVSTYEKIWCELGKICSHFDFEASHVLFCRNDFTLGRLRQVHTLEVAINNACKMNN